MGPGGRWEALLAFGTVAANRASIMKTRNLSLSLVASMLALAPLTGCDEKEPNTSDDIEDEEEAGAEQGESDESGSESGGEETGEGGEQPQPQPQPQEPWPAEALPCAEVEPRDCELAPGKAGVDYCIEVEGEQVWTGCVEEFGSCVPGENNDMGCIGSYCAWDGEKLYSFNWQTDPECATPLVLSFDAAPIRFEASASAPAFDFAATTACTTDWPSVPWLALDRDHNGMIDSGRELFGSGTRLASGGRAAHGFEALAELDADGDGRITPADPRFAELVLWSDGDDDRAGDLAELVPAGDRGLVAIHLDFQRRNECDERGNCGLERAAFEYRDASGQPRVGEIVDVYLACQ